MLDYSFKEKDYRVSKVPAMKQFYIARRFAGPLTQASGFLNELASLKTDNLEQAEIAPIISALCSALQNLSDADAEFIFNASLEATQVKDSTGGWAYLRRSGSTMFEVELDELLYIVFQFLKVNFSGFIQALSSRARGLTSDVTG